MGPHSRRVRCSAGWGLPELDARRFCSQAWSDSRAQASVASVRGSLGEGLARPLEGDPGHTWLHSGDASQARAMGPQYGQWAAWARTCWGLCPASPRGLLLPGPSRAHLTVHVGDFAANGDQHLPPPPKASPSTGRVPNTLGRTPACKATRLGTYCALGTALSPGIQWGLGDREDPRGTGTSEDVRPSRAAACVMWGGGSHTGSHEQRGSCFLHKCSRICARESQPVPEPTEAQRWLHKDA